MNRTTCLPVGNDKHDAIWQIKRYFRSDACRYDVIHRGRGMVFPHKQLAGPEINEFESIAGDVSMEHLRWQSNAHSGRQLYNTVIRLDNCSVTQRPFHVTLFL